ncbi:Calmodulin binding protein-like [Musa troglodytarum]|uniref:Calmodulin binding protein-like n=1 Tax=Musa troglodytarum TaxID=320322 RepID=A0A9E7E9Y1_9LILI|nr:Calmodulin binding protein-like [Musa troglodytarum]
MATKKRPLLAPGEEEREGGEGSRTIKRWRPLIREVMGEQHMKRFLMRLESFVCRLVQDEIRKLLVKWSLPAPSKRCHLLSSDAELYQLQFQNGLPEKLYTLKPIMTKNQNLVQISIIDTATGKRVTSGPWSSVQVEVLALHGDFNCDGQKRWTKDEFNNHIVVARKGKGPLLTGELIIQLTNGVGYLDNVSFSDNSSWTRSQKFRLALRLYKAEGAQEGISETLRVKDRRGQLNEKHHPPSLTDEVWYLEKIRKDGSFHKRLVNAGIHCVKQFLQALSMDHDNLCKLLGNGESSKKGIAKRTWEAIVANARECPPGNELYSYNVVGQTVTLIFNSVYELLGAKLDGQYQTISDFSTPQRASVEIWKRCAFDDTESFNLDHVMVDNSPVPLSQEYDHLVTVSSSLGSCFPRLSDDAFGQVGLLNEPFAPYGEITNHLPQLEETFSIYGVHPLKKSTCSQETENSCSVSTGIINMLVNHSTMCPPTANGIQISESSIQMENDELVTQVGIEQFFHDTSSKQSMQSLQALASFQATMFNSSDNVDERTFQNEPCTSRLVERTLGDDEIHEFIMENWQPNTTMTLVPTSIHKWVKLIAVAQVWNLYQQVSRGRKSWNCASENTEWSMYLNQSGDS